MPEEIASGKTLPPLLSRKQFTALYFGFILLCFFSLKFGILIPDGLGYYSFLPGLFHDRDLLFWNEFGLGGAITKNFIHVKGLTTTGYVSNHYPVGSALLWSPFWIVGHILAETANYFGQRWPLNGFSVYYNIGVRFSTALYSFCAILLSTIWARRYSDTRSSAWGALLIAFGTPVFWYSFSNADMAHIPAFFAISIFVLLWEKRRHGGSDTLSLLCMGLAGGLAAIIRQQNFVIFILPVFLWIAELIQKRNTPKGILKDILFTTLGAALVVSLQLRIWGILFGNPLGPIVEKGISETDNFFYVFFDHFYFYEVLLSSYHGLLFFSPILVFSFWGLIRLFRKDAVLASACLTILIGQIIFTAAQRWFWEGLSFGLRQMVDWAPLYILGLSIAMKEIKFKATKVLILLFAAWTILLAWTYSNRSMAVLNEYQPPYQLLNWILETIANLPESMIERLVPGAPLGYLLPALLIFGLIGYYVSLGMLRFAEECNLEGATPPQPQKRIFIPIVTGVLVVLVIAFQILVSIADRNGEYSKTRYAHELQWLKGRTRSLLASEITEHLLNEARYKALSSGWQQALPSFREAIQMAPNEDYALSRIREFATKHLPKNEVDPYLARVLSKS